MKAVWEGTFTVFGVRLRCYILEDDRRVIEAVDVFRLMDALGNEDDRPPGDYSEFAAWQRKEVFLPFLPEFEGAMLEGRKTATARNRRYGQPGDLFSAFGSRFQLTRVEHVPLEAVAAGWEREGCSSKQDFIALWKRLHPRRGWRPEQKVWWHWFGRVKEEANGR